MSPWTRHAGAPRTLRYAPIEPRPFYAVARTDQGWAVAAPGVRTWTFLATPGIVRGWCSLRGVPLPTDADLEWLTENSNRTETP